MKFCLLSPFLAFILLLGLRIEINQTQNEEATTTPESFPTLTTTPIPARDLDLLPTFEAISSIKYENCTLPCWWGLKLEETTFDDIIEFILKNGFERQWKEGMYAESLTLEEYIQYGERIVLDLEDTFYDPASNFELSFSFDQANILQAIFINYRNPDKWLSTEADRVSLPKILNQIQVIPSIYIAENPSTFRISDYNLTMRIPEQGINIRYTFDLTIDNPINVPLEHLKLCLDLNRTQSIQITLSQPFEVEPLSEHYQTPETAYGIGIPTEEFVEFFREHPDECLDVAQYQIEHAE